MNKYLWSTAAVLFLLATLSGTECRSIKKRSPSVDALGSHEHGDNSLEHYKDKKKVEVVFGVKDAILGFVFDRQRRSPKSPLFGFAWETTPKTPTTTEDIVMFTPGQPVSLEVPDELFGSSFTLVTNLSNTIGDYMINSAVRMQKLLESMRPFLRFVFGAKGVIIEGPTDKPIFSDPNEVKDS